MQQKTYLLLTDRFGGLLPTHQGVEPSTLHTRIWFQVKGPYYYITSITDTVGVSFLDRALLTFQDGISNLVSNTHLSMHCYNFLGIACILYKL